MELVALHVAPHAQMSRIQKECIDILNYEWPRSKNLRIRSIESSRDDFPICMALVQDFEGYGLSVLGHVRLTRIPSIPDGVWIESVVIHPDVRGKGVGKYLMLLSENYAKSRGYATAYLSTIDKQAFYSRIGYSFCDPVCAYGGNIRLPSGLLSEKPVLMASCGKTKIESKEKSSVNGPMKRPECPLIDGKNSTPSSIGESRKTPKEVPKEASHNDAYAEFFKRQTLKDVKPPELIKKPLRCLEDELEEIKKLKKTEVHRLNFPKSYMTKEL